MGGGGEEGQAPARSSRPPSCHARSVEFPLAARQTSLSSRRPLRMGNGYQISELSDIRIRLNVNMDIRIRIRI